MELHTNNLSEFGNPKSFFFSQTFDAGWVATECKTWGGMANNDNERIPENGFGGVTDKAWEATKQLVVMVEYVRAQVKAKPDSVWHFETTASGGAMAKHPLMKDFLLGSKEKGGLGFALTEISQCQVGGP